MAYITQVIQRRLHLDDKFQGLNIFAHVFQIFHCQRSNVQIRVVELRKE